MLGEEKKSEMMVVMMRDVHLDDVNVLNRLRRVFEAYSVVSPKPTFILLGDFVSSRSLGVNQVLSAFDALGEVLSSYPALVEESHFVLVGGVGDVGWGGMFPRSGVCDVVLDEV